FMIPRPLGPTLLPYTTLFRSRTSGRQYSAPQQKEHRIHRGGFPRVVAGRPALPCLLADPDYGQLPSRIMKNSRLSRLPPLMPTKDRKSTRLNSSHVKISYAVF